ncbi:FAD-dependent oxidoreductase [Polyangium aurulentum]|uniref:FAD-dependent oxidoreductase n=1 Tax=Polyangium aurulentum TaxID=2567896 RepID=UPI0010AE3C35|nr:lycopene cyclase [Polyangium aurulentum]UQA61883.1 lycopene cyclase [Polyangium aurulentum]
MISPEEAARRVRESGGEALCERLEHLDRARAARATATRAPPVSAPDRGAVADYDVAIAGGGLWLLIAPLLAARGLKVAVLDRARIGSAHREWNCSAKELSALSASGLLTEDEVRSLVVARYARGVCRWHGGGSYAVTNVLDHAVDAGELLAAVRARCEARGVTLLDGQAVTAHAEGRDAVALAVGAGAGSPTRTLTAKILVDARGASSPFATADLVCPTVGGVLEGLEEGEDEARIQPDVGEILATTEGIEDGRQHIWEAFPGRRGEVTVYLFYYALADAPGASLLSLYARFFERMPLYKRGAFRLVRPTFGFIPGWSRLVPAPAPPGRRVVLVGDAAARHSPLTFCGFGSALRSFALLADVIARAVETGSAHEKALADAPIHAGTGALARLMCTPSRSPARANELNALLDTAFSTLHEMGDEAYGALLRDEMSPRDFIRFLRTTAARRPRVYRDVLGSLRLGALGRWGLGLVREIYREIEVPR